jgi:branched-chain amino acid transport system ATP-binding protein
MGIWPRPSRAVSQPGAHSGLELVEVTAGYYESVVLRDVSLQVNAGEVVALIGANGVGKTTTLRVASGLLKPIEGRVLLKGLDVTSWSPHERARAGLCLIPEGRGVFKSLTVRENLLMAQPPWIDSKGRVEETLDRFTALKTSLEKEAGQLSGGQQQMLALARAFLAEPSVVLLDEVSMGLAPLVVEEIFESLRQLSATGMAIILVEQYVHQALSMADTALILERGAISYRGPASSLDEAFVARRYLGGVA